MTDMKQSIKITVASISALVLAVACIVAAPLLKDVLNDIVNPAYRETVIFPDDGRANPKDTTICIDGIEIRMIGVRGGKIHCEGLRHEFEIEDFYLGETEVTQGLWKAVMGDNPAHILEATGIQETCWKKGLGMRLIPEAGLTL